MWVCALGVTQHSPVLIRFCHLFCWTRFLSFFGCLPGGSAARDVFRRLWPAVLVQEEGWERRGGRLWDSWVYSSPAPSRELRLFWKLLEPSAPPWCPDAGAKGGCAVAPPSRAVLADACPARTRVAPADYGHHLSCVWFGPAFHSRVLRGQGGAFALSVLCLNSHPGWVSHRSIELAFPTT